MQVQVLTTAQDVLARLEARADRVRLGIEIPEPRTPELSEGSTAPLFETLLRRSFDGIVLNARASRRMIEVSDAFCRMTGYERAELLGRTSVELGLVDAHGTRDVATQQADAGQEGLYETRMTCKDGTTKWVEFSHQLIGADYVLTIIRDVTRRKGLEEDLRRMADTDPLTGVLNTRRFHEEVERALLESHRFGDEVTLLLVDVDHFKAINDTYGHPAGDVALQQVAGALSGALRDTDFVGRVGGDEFAALLTRPHPGAAERVIRTFRRALQVRRAGLPPLRASVGMAFVTDATITVDDLYAVADRALYLDKARAAER